jgi:hypothetical protein
MKRSINKLDKFNTIGTIMNNNPGPFTGFPEIIEARDLFIVKKTRISVLVTELKKPKTEVFGLKTDSRNKLRSALKLAIGTGITVAKRQSNAPLLLALKNYKLTLNRTTIHDLPEMAQRVHTELMQNVTIAAGAGLTAEKLTALQELTTNFREIIESTDYMFNIRKTSRKELRTLVSECIHILQDELDPFVGHCKDTFPDFYNAYTTAREPQKRANKKGVINTAFADITGTVTDSVTGLPIANAILNLLEEESVFNTDEDGYYEIDELLAGKYNLSCHSPGYDVPENVKAEAAAGESLVIDFILVPVKAALN